MSSVLRNKHIDDVIDTDEGSAVANTEGQENRSLSEGFDLKSEYYEKNIEVSKKLLESEQDVVTKVKVHKKDSIVEIDADQIKDVIKNNKDIKQIVVEKISLEEATRYSLFFTPKAENDSESLLLDHSNQISENSVSTTIKKRWNLQELESLVNNNFIKSNSVKESYSDEKMTEGKLHFRHAGNKKKEAEESNEHVSLDFVDTHDDDDETIDSNVVEETKEKRVKLNLKLKNKDREKNELLHLDNDDTEKTLKYQKHTLTKKKNRSNKSYYYKAKDHMELYKVGSSYLEDFKAGLKSFSFSSNGIACDREKTVFGICSFFNYHEDLNICILTSDLLKTFYSEICEDFEEKEIQVFDEDLTLKINRAKGFDLIQYKDLKKVERKIRDYDFETFVDYLSDRYDLLLWDLPELSILDSNKELYFPIIRTLDNVSLVVKKDVSKISEIGDMISYYNRYQVDIKGLLYSSDFKNSRSGGNS
jgi:hypothetical protein